MGLFVADRETAKSERQSSSVTMAGIGWRLGRNTVQVGCSLRGNLGVSKRLVEAHASDH